MTNVYVMKNRLIYLVTCLTVVVIMPAMSPTDQQQNADSNFMGLVMPVRYTQEPLLMFKRICINVYVNQR